MMRADVFSLIAISMSVQLIENSNDSEAIKKGVLKFLEFECNEKV